ncbi:hypothetical protein J4H92_14870 [Leucobacter weissii]|uniref:Uncharacterized protein n=1 Tax=Leucobacter weissii TaxID=1983706 RepID=A0A939MNS3_9MICO|nr:hypothetical protein [Leucobacter weissii]MBO1903225.1 hypothetical protein [Leucobacter weissii]
MSALQIVYYVGIGVGIIMFVASWLIRRKQVTEGPLARAEKPLLLAGAGITFVFALLGFATL